MGFRESLEEVCGVEGAIAACVMGFDGIAIDTVTPVQSDVDIEALLVEYTAILGQVQQAAEVLQTGLVNELSIGTDRVTTLLRPINEDYFLLLALGSEGNIGRGRYLLRVTAPRLRQEF